MRGIWQDTRRAIASRARARTSFSPTLTPAITTTHQQSTHDAWSAVGAMTLCVAMLIASEFMPVSLLTPIAKDLGATYGMAGNAISISGLFAVATSLLVASVSSRFDLRNVLVFFAVLMMASLVLIAEASSFSMLMLARGLLGITIGGFWSLSTAAIMRLVSERNVTKALGIMHMGGAAATALAAPIGSYLGGMIGWRGVFWSLVPLAAVSVGWLLKGLPSLPPRRAVPTSRVFGLLRQRHVRFAVAACMMTFTGAFATFTYLRPFLETRAHASVGMLSLLLLALGVAGFAGTSGATSLLGKRLFALLWSLPLALAAATIALVLVAPTVGLAAVVLFLWGALNAAVPVAWSNWLTREVRHEPEAGGSLLVAAIQIAIMTGAGLGGLLLDHFSVDVAFLGSALLLVMAAVTAGRTSRLRGSEN